MSRMMDICSSADMLRRPQKKEEVTLKSSVKRKAAQKGRGPRKALQRLPTVKDSTTSLKADADMAWISATTCT